MFAPHTDSLAATALVDRPVASHIPLSLDHLDHLEAEAIHIFREVAGEFERPVVLFSGGKDSVVMLHLAVKAFAPAPPPFALLHVDTGHNFPEVLEFRGIRIAPVGTAARNPAFDVTPAELITGVVTEEGLLTAPFEPAFRAAVERARERWAATPRPATEPV